MLVPVATPIVYIKSDEFDGNLGDISAAHPLYARYKKALEDTMSDGYARLIDPYGSTFTHEVDAGGVEIHAELTATARVAGRCLARADAQAQPLTIDDHR